MDEDKEYQGKIILLLGFNDIFGNKRGKVLDYVYEFIHSSDDSVREEAIVVLGWMGNNKDIELLGEILLKDSCNKCRAVSAASFVQIWRYKFDDTLFYEKAMPYLQKSILQEKDYFVINHIIYVIRILTQKTFGISKKTIDGIILYEEEFNKEEIDKSKNKVIKYFEKLYKE